MEAILGLIILYGLGKLLFGKRPNRRAPNAGQSPDTIFDYPEGGCGLADDASYCPKCAAKRLKEKAKKK